MFKNSQYKNNKLAFTLSEVLVTLTIIGVIAAVVVTAVNSSAPKKNKVMFRKAYLTLQKAVDGMINDDYLYPSNQKYEIATGVFVSKGFQFGDDTGTKESLKSGTTYYNKFCYHLAKKFELVGAQTCSDDGVKALTKFATTTDGMDWYIYTPTTSATTDFTIGTPATAFQTKVIVDINGASNSPNCSQDTQADSFTTQPWTEGTATTCPLPDVFIFSVRYDGSIRAGMSTASGDSVTDAYAEKVLKSPLVSK